MRGAEHPEWNIKIGSHSISNKTRPGDLVMPDPFGWLFSDDLDYFKPYKNQFKPGYKGHPIELMVDILKTI